MFVGDPSQLQAGDYLLGSQTWFVSHIEPLRPAVCTLCNRILSIGMPAAATVAGVNSYGGNTAVGISTIASSWPASVLAKTHIEIDPTRLPSDIKSSFFEVLLPPIPGTNLTFGLTLQDDLAQNYVISSAELSLAGWRLLASIQTT